MIKKLFIAIAIIASSFSFTANAQDYDIPETCSLYYDGCNECSVTNGKTDACTERACIMQWEPKCLEYSTDKTDEDNQIVDAVVSKEVKKLETSFKLQSASSCSEINDTIKKYLVPNDRFRIMPHYLEEPAIVDFNESTSDASNLKSSVWGNISKTNTQVENVDETDIIKSHGNTIYYFKQSENSIYMINAVPANDMKVLKKINLPKNFYNSTLYTDNNKLIILSNSNVNRDYYWDEGSVISQNIKTYVMVYDTTNPEKLELQKIYWVNWELRKSRKIEDKLYILSSNYIYSGRKIMEDKNIISSLKKSQLVKEDDKNKQNFKIKGKTYPYNIKKDVIADCSDVELLVPWDDASYNWNAGILTVSVMDLKDLSKEVNTKVIVWSIEEIYMSTDSLYLTSRASMKDDFVCAPWFMCAMPFFSYRNNTVVHKFDVWTENIDYKDSILLEWHPLTQYSMDEKDWNFRILTQARGKESYVNLYILDENMQVLSKLEKLWLTEEFKSSRFMWDKLYLVTFERTDPLFAIDLSDAKNPKVMGELKIPGYSTYLHPYNEDYIIGLWTDTRENSWGGISNFWIKVDLYDVSDFKNPKQKFTKTLWWNGSYSEALDNPRMFMFDKENNLLLLPATLSHYKNSSVKFLEWDEELQKDFFTGMIAIEIDDKKWISERARITHINMDNISDMRKEKCEPYLEKAQEAEVCKELINGETHCTKRSTYVPDYCYNDINDAGFAVLNRWEFNKEIIKRALYGNDAVYTISDKKIQTNSLSNFSVLDSVELK